MEGSWEGIVGCVVHVDMHGGCVCCGWMQCIVAIERGRCSLSCMQETVSSAGFVW